MKTPAQTIQPKIITTKNSVSIIKEDAESLVINCDHIQYHFDKVTGYLKKVVNDNKEISFSGGPALGGST